MANSNFTTFTLKRRQLGVDLLGFIRREGTGVGILICFLLGIAIVLAPILYLYHNRMHRTVICRKTRAPQIKASGGCPLLLPGCWLVVKCRDLVCVQSALSLHNPRFCTWMEGLTNADGLFIAPPVKGWILVVGGRLTDPWRDIDVCFRFLLDLSKKVGTVQFFSANRATLRHAWVKVEAGRVVRAYAWAGKTAWLQGPRTKSEKELQLTCFDYCEPFPNGQITAIETNLDKVPLLAAKWGLDPRLIQQHLALKEHGLTGEPAHRY
jgi:hypothetical protein